MTRTLDILIQMGTARTLLGCTVSIIGCAQVIASEVMGNGYNQIPYRTFTSGFYITVGGLTSTIAGAVLRQRAQKRQDPSRQH